MMTIPIFDQLTDATFQTFVQHSLSKEDAIEYVLKSIVVNVGNIINTKTCAENIPPEFKELNVSVLTYGTSDFSSLSILSDDEINKARISLEKALLAFEPRLYNTALSIKNKEPLVFAVKANLYLDTICHDAHLELSFITPHMHYTVENMRLEVESV